MKYTSFMEALKGKQHKIDKNKNGKIDAHDFKLLRKEEAEESNESFDFNRAAIAKQRLQNLRHQGRKVRGARIANLMRAAGLKEEELEESELDQLDEVLSADAKAGDWIHDFVHSTNPKFEGKSKKERIQMALGAYYAKKRSKDGEGISEAVKTTHEDPLVTVHDKDGLHTHANLSTANHIFGTNVKHTDVHAGPVKTKDGHETKRDLTFAISKHHKTAMKEETDTSEKHEMAETQLHFIKYAAEEILDYIKMGGEIEEWYQNKLSKVQSEVESLHSYIEGESRRTGLKEASKKVGQPVNIDKVHAAGQEPHEEKFETVKKKTVKEEFDEEGNVNYSKVTFSQFMEAMTAKQVAPGVTRYTGGSYGSSKGAKYGNTDYDNEDIDKKEDDDQPQKRGRGRPAGSKSGARGPRIK